MLSPRLRKVADYVKQGSVVGDVGSDHAYVVVDLVERGVVEKAIASDLNAGPVNNAKRNINEHGMSDVIETRLGGGLEPYEVGEVDTIIVAGMGGILISEILEASKEISNSIDYFIFQPMNYQDYLRRYLSQNGFKCIDESVVREGEKFYQILLYKRGKMDVPSEMELIYGIKMLKDDEDSKSFIKSELKKIKKIKKNLRNSMSEESIKKLTDLNNQEKYLEAFGYESK